MSPLIVTAGILIIGDEVLSGRTQDKNVSYIAKKLAEKGIDVIEVRIVRDKDSAIINALNALRTQYDYVFTTGGIGGTHDDITARCIAQAFSVEFVMNDYALACIKNRYHDRFTSHHEQMAWMPKGSSLIQNKLSGVPSFYIENVFVLAGMPSVMHVMLDDVLPLLKHGDSIYTNSLTSKALESEISHDLAAIQNNYPTVTIGSYPFYNDQHKGTTLVLRSRIKHDLRSATRDVDAMLNQLGHAPSSEFEVKP